MTAPTRIQLCRTKGWRMPPNTVKVDRSTRWGNPFKVGDEYLIGFTANHRRQAGIIRSSAMAVELFRAAILKRKFGLLDFDLHELARLRGKNLACWCKPGAPCHADVLLELANRPLGSVE